MRTKGLRKLYDAKGFLIPSRMTISSIKRYKRHVFISQIRPSKHEESIKALKAMILQES